MHLEKAYWPIYVTLVGIATDVNFVHPDKVLFPSKINISNSDNNVNMISYLPIDVVLLAKSMKQGSVVHRLQQPIPSLLLQVTRSIETNYNDSNDVDNSSNKINVISYRTQHQEKVWCSLIDMEYNYHHAYSSRYHTHTGRY